MPQKPYPSHPKEAIVRVYSAGGEFFGTGCLTVDGLVVTCAHVIRDALPPTKFLSEPPAGDVGIDFPFLMEGAAKRLSYPAGAPYRAHLVPGGWGWTEGVEPCNDIAVLRLIGEPPLAGGWYFSGDAHLDQTLSVFVHGFRKVVIQRGTSPTAP